MSPNEALSLAKKRVKNQASGVDWNSLYGIVLDDIFCQEFKFSRRELSFFQPAQTFEKTFDTDDTEKALDKIISIRQRGTTQYTLTLPPIPDGDPNNFDSDELGFIPAQRFYTLYPNPHTQGIPFCYTELRANDGTNGMKIGIYYLGTTQRTFAVLGYFRPNKTIDSNPIQILPVHFHSMVVDQLIYYAAEELGLDSLSNRAGARFLRKFKLLERWDSNNPKYTMARQLSYGKGDPRRIRFPANFPAKWSR